MLSTSKTFFRNPSTGGTTDPFFPYVPLLLDTGDSSSRSTTVVDSSTNNFTVTRTGAPSTGWVSPYQTDGYWGNFFSNGALSVTSANLNPVSTAQTIEFWVYASSYTSVLVIYEAGTGSIGNLVIFSQSGQILFGLAGGSTVASTPILNQWNYIACVKSASNNYSIYLNGTRVGGPTAIAAPTSQTAINIGARNGTGTPFVGYISNLRVTNSELYTASTMTVPTAPLAPIANTQLLICQSNRFKDNSTNNFAITVNGTPQVSGYWYPSTFTAPTASPGAGFFNGTADCLLLPTSPLTLSTTGSFTLEAWVYTTSTSDQTIFYLLGNTTTYAGIRVGLSSSAAYILHSQSGNNWAVSSGNQGSVRINTWNHIAVTRNVNAGTLWINGVSVYTFTFGTLYSSTVNYIAATYVNTAPGVFFSGYISNARIVNGTAVYTGTFTPPTLAFLQTSGSASAASYPSTINVNTSFAASNTSLLVNLADSNFVSATNGVQNNTFIDNSNYAFPITRNGSATQGSVTPYWPNGYWSNYFIPASQIGNTSTSVGAFGSNNFTVECWFYPTVAPSASVIYLLATLNGASNNGWQLYYFNSGWGVRSNSANFITGATVLPTTNAWNHVAWTRNNSTGTATYYLYLNGVRINNNDTSMGTWTDTTVTVNIASANTFSGYISNVRFVNGVAVYAAGNKGVTVFTPPSLAPLQTSGAASAACYPSTTNVNTSFSSASTTLLTCQSNRFRDNSANNIAFTTTSTPTVQAFQPFSPVASYTPAAYGGSGYLGGTGNYLVGSGTIIPITSTTFTIECWIYPTVAPTGTIPVVIGSMLPTTASNDISFGIPSSRLLQLYWFDGAAKTCTGNTTIPLNAWTHIAASVTSNAIALYVNGVSQTLTGTTTLTNRNIATGSFAFGQNNNANHFYTGYISNARVINGVSVYSGAFTPPTLAPLTAAGSTSAASYSSTTNVNTVFPSSNTAILTNFSNAGIYDAAVQNNAITVGDAQASTTITAQWPPTSMRFDGTGDWLTTIDKPQLQLGTSDFTIDGWFYLTANGVAYGLVSKGAASTGWSVNVTSGNRLQFSYTASNLTGATTTLAAATWYYFAVVRSGSATGNLKIYINGSVEATSGGAVNDNFNQTDILYVGASRTGTTPLNGYLQDIRITRYARTITTPTAAFPTR